MASGHVNRTNRPNTWLLRPLLHREESSCQPGAVHTWPDSEAPTGNRRVRLLWCPCQAPRTRPDALHAHQREVD